MDAATLLVIGLFVLLIAEILEGLYYVIRKKQKKAKRSCIRDTWIQSLKWREKLKSWIMNYESDVLG